MRQPFDSLDRMLQCPLGVNVDWSCISGLGRDRWLDKCSFWHC